MNNQRMDTLAIFGGGRERTAFLGKPKQAVPNGQRGMRPSAGFTLMEVVFSMSLLSVATLGLALTIPAAVQSNNRNRVDAEGALLVQKEVEQMLAQPLSTTSFTDSSGNAITISAGGAPLASGKIDYSQATVAGYNVTVTGTAGALYQLRWNVQSLADGSKQFTVAANRTGGQRYLLPPVNIVSRRGAW